MSKEKPEIGEMIKVFLPGESPWAECVAVEPDGTWHGRIDNFLIAQSDELRQAIVDRDWGGGEPLKKLHGFKQNDVVRFKLEAIDDRLSIWTPAEPPGGRA